MHVSLIDNILPSIYIIYNKQLLSYIHSYAGALGTVRGFGWCDEMEQNPPINNDPTADMHREPPILFVQMDTYYGTSISPTIPNLVSFTFQKKSLADKYYRWQYPLALGHAPSVNQNGHVCEGFLAYMTKM